MPSHDLRIDLEPLRSEDLYHIARNHCAQHRLLAGRMLVERGSPLACADELIELAKDVIFSDPITLATCHQNMDAATAAKLPGPIELIASGLQKHIALANKVAEALDAVQLAGQVAALALARDLTAQRQQLQKVLAAHAEELQAVQARLALLERSPWAKLKKLVN